MDLAPSKLPWWACLLCALAFAALLSFMGARFEWSIFSSLVAFVAVVAMGALAAQSSLMSKSGFVAYFVGAILGTYELHVPAVMLLFWSIGGFAP
jgi:hypothetical protein